MVTILHVLGCILSYSDVRNMLASNLMLGGQEVRLCCRKALTDNALLQMLSM